MGAPKKTTSKPTKNYGSANKAAGKQKPDSKSKRFADDDDDDEDYDKSLDDDMGDFDTFDDFGDNDDDDDDY